MAPKLGDFERLVLICLVRIGDGAYGAEVRRELTERTGRDVTPGKIYPTLDRLERKGLARSWMGEATAERGGRAKRHYALTPEGLRTAAESWEEVRAHANQTGATWPYNASLAAQFNEFKRRYVALGMSRLDVYGHDVDWMASQLGLTDGQV